MKNRYREVNLVFLISLLVFILIVNLLARMTGMDAMALQMVVQILLIAPYIVYLAVTGQNVLQCIRLKRIKVSSVLLTVIFTLAIYPLLGFINVITMLFSNNVVQQTVTEVMEGKPFWLSLVVLALMPSIFEEFVYRGVLYNEYRKTSLIKGMLLSALLFGLMHRNLNQFAYTFVMAILLTLLMEATDSILAPMIVHFTINGTSVTLAYNMKHMLNGLSGYGDSEEFFGTGMQDMMGEWLWFILIAFGVMSIFSIAIGGLLLAGIAKVEGRLWLWKQPTFWKKGERVGGILTFPLVVGMLICILFIVISFMYS